MTPEYEYIDIDPANPPEMPLDGCLFSDDDFALKNKSNELPRTLTEIFFGKSGKMLFEDHNGIIWKCCKLRKEKTIDFRNRWVKIKTWAEMEKEYGLDAGRDIKCGPCFTKYMEAQMPKNRIIYIGEKALWDGYTMTKEMISEILPLDYQPERELDDTVKRLWWYVDFHDSWVINNRAMTEKEFVNRYTAAKQYAPGPITPEEKEWRKV